MRGAHLPERCSARFTGAVFANGLFFFSLLSQAPAEFHVEDAPRAIVAVLLLALIGSVMGALFGVPTGFIVGLLNGLLLGIATRTFFYPLRDAQTYRRVIGLISVGFTTVASWLGFFAIMLFDANTEKANVPVLAMGVLIPALIAGIAAVFLSRVIARWYKRRVQNDTAPNKYDRHGSHPRADESHRRGVNCQHVTSLKHYFLRNTHHVL